MFRVQTNDSQSADGRDVWRFSRGKDERINVGSRRWQSAIRDHHVEFAHVHVATWSPHENLRSKLATPRMWPARKELVS